MKQESKVPFQRRRSTVRFTNEEFLRIKEESQVSGLSVPALLKLSHFSKKNLQLLLNQEERHQLAIELRRMGNNINQIAKKVNSGVLEGWNIEISEINQQLSELKLLIAGKYGLR